MKKYFISILFAVLLSTVAVSAAGLFPVPHTAESGITGWGYLDDTATQQIGYFYADAQPINAYGFAIVTNIQGEVGVINSAGKLIVPCLAAPRKVEFADNAIAYRYATQSVYYDQNGTQIGSFANAQGFFHDGLLRVLQNDVWGYVDVSGAKVIAPQYSKAGDFVNGRALVQDSTGQYAVLSIDGSTVPLVGEPSTLDIGKNGQVVLQETTGYRLYSLTANTYLSASYTQMQIQQDGYVLVQRNNKWGILTPNGKESIAPQYYYLTYMGEGAYAARGLAGTTVSVIDGAGTPIYVADTYIGGFESFVHGLSWHGTVDGGVLFFNKNGAFTRKIDGASNPTVLSENVVRVVVDDVTQYIRLSDGKVLYSPIRQYTLAGGVKVRTQKYEKYLGTRSAEAIGWSLEYPQLSGMKNASVQAKLNSAIEKFFLDGPSLTAQTQSLVGSYGFAIYGRVLVVNADAVQGTGVGATTWNDNIALNIDTGAQYTVSGDLLTKQAQDAIKEQLPSEIPFYEYSYPRMTANSLLYYRNVAQTEDAALSTQVYKIPYTLIDTVINTRGECYNALTQQADAQPSFDDVPASHWASAYIEQVAQQGWMQGAGGRFTPNAALTKSQAVVVLARMQKLPAGKMPGVTGVWYADAYGGAYEAGLLRSLESGSADAVISRCDAMQLFANAFNDQEDMTQTQVQEILASFTDADSIPVERQQAVAWCVKNQIINGASGLLSPNDTLTRAQFAKMIATIALTD